jgi:hypothetical protein
MLSGSKGCYVVPLLIAIALSGLVTETAAARESSCPSLIKKQSKRPIPAEPPSPNGTLTAVNDEGIPIPKATLVMDFGSGRDRDVRTQTFQLSGDIDPATVRVSPVNDFVSGNEPLPIGHEQLTYRAGVDSATGLINVRVCYDPGGHAEPAAGRYVGGMTVSAPGVKAAFLSLEVTIRDNGLAGVIFALMIGIAAGAAVQAIAMYQQAPKQSRPSGWQPYLLNLRTLVSVGAGVVAAIATYSKVVDGDPTWNGSVAALLSLASATFFGTLAAKTAADLKGPTQKEKEKGLAPTD